MLDDHNDAAGGSTSSGDGSDSNGYETSPIHLRIFLDRLKSETERNPELRIFYNELEERLNGEDLNLQEIHRVEVLKDFSDQLRKVEPDRLEGIHRGPGPRRSPHAEPARSGPTLGAKRAAARLSIISEALEKEAGPKAAAREADGNAFDHTKFWPMRWNPYTRCTYYALDLETATDEVSHRWNKSKADAIPMIHQLASFAGLATSVEPFVAEHPELFADKWSFKCQVVAYVALKKGVDALVAPSARRSDGTCLPVYRRQRVQQKGSEPGKFRYCQEGQRWRVDKTLH